MRPLAFVLLGSALCYSASVLCCACWPFTVVSCGALLWCATWCAPPPPPPGRSLLVFCFVLCRAAVVLVCALLCCVVLVSCGAAAPLGAAVVGRCLVSCSLVPRSRVGCFVSSTALFCAALILWRPAARCAALVCTVSAGVARGAGAPCCLAWCCVVCGAVLCCCALWCFLLGCVVSWCVVSSGVPLCGVAPCLSCCAIRTCPPPSPLLLPLLAGCALRLVVFRRVLLRVWCCLVPRRCSRFLLSVLLCAVAFGWCCGVLLCAVLFLLAFPGVVALPCGVVCLRALVWFSGAFVCFAGVVVHCCLLCCFFLHCVSPRYPRGTGVCCAAVLSRLWLLCFCWCLAASCCAVLSGARLRACVVARCGAFFVAVCCPGALCRAALCWFCLPVQPCLPPTRVAALVVWLCPASCGVPPCHAARVVLCCAALVLSLLLFLLVCAVAVAWCCGAFLCALLLIWVFCGTLVLPCCVVLCVLVPWCPVLCPVVLCCFPLLCYLGLLCIFFSVCGFFPFFCSKTSAVGFVRCFVFGKSKSKKTKRKKPLFNQNFHSLFPCDLVVAGERTGETG